MKYKFERITKKEKTHIIKNFYNTAGISKPVKLKKTKRWISVAAAFVVFLSVMTPVGQNAWAKTREAFMGIGEFLGASEEDKYMTVIDETQKKGNIIFTLNEAIASDYQMRFSVTVKKDNGEVLGLSEVCLSGVTYIDGKRLGGDSEKQDIVSTGTGYYGSKKEKNKGIYFLGVSYINFEMPLNPEIKVSFSAGNEIFTFDFVLENEKFKDATKEMYINKEYKKDDGKVVCFEKLIITPLEQVIVTAKEHCGEEYPLKNKRNEIYIVGTDNKGNNVCFIESGFDGNFYGFRRDDEETYELDSEVSSYTLAVARYNNEEYIPVGDCFTINIPQK